MPDLRHYAVCDCCQREQRVRAPGAKPVGWRKTLVPADNTPLLLCTRCTSVITQTLRALGWKPNQLEEVASG